MADVKYANLDVINPEDKKIKINGELYLIPGDLPVKAMTEALKYSQMVTENITNVKGLEGFVVSLWNILKIRKPDLEIEMVENLGFKKLIALFTFIYGGVPPEETFENIEKTTKEVTEKKKESD